MFTLFRNGNRFAVQLGIMLFVFAVTATQAAGERRNFVGYYPSWLSAQSRPLAATSAVYSHVVLAFARPDFSWDGKSWSGTGLQFSQQPAVVKNQMRILRAHGTRVLLAVGGATYLNWAPLAAEGDKPGLITAALTRFVSTMGFDGIDVDYEREGASAEVVTQYGAAIAVLRRTTPGKLLSLAAWSTGADCTPDTGNVPCDGQFSSTSGSAGRERLLLHDSETMGKIDLVNVMSYDAGVSGYDPVKAFALYRDLLPARVAVNLGFEIAPEGWGGATLVQDDAAARCPSAMITQDQFGNPVHRTYALQRGLQDGPLTLRPNSNAHDGAMLWHIVKNQNLPVCGHRAVLSVDSLQKAAAILLSR
ncbi:MAG: glycoside hydrolase family 18 protein [Rhizomicrobium sp.]|nr:glycoside hydrolase family 18 protein [Rhizomicrobium sp.]